MEEINNRFKKAANAPRVAPGGKKEPPVVEEEVEIVEEKPILEKKDNPLAGLVEPKSKSGKPCGFYLSEEAIDKLEKLAKQNNCSKSKALDVLLRSL